MTDQETTEQTPKPAAPMRTARGPLAGMPPVERSMTFGPSVRRLLGLLRPDAPRIAAVLGLTVLAVSLSVVGPRVLGHAIDLIFTGTPSGGVDFGEVGRVLLGVLALYVGASLAQLLQAWLLTDAVNAAVRRLRGEIEDKVHRLPLTYLDGQPRGELLSRVTNDVDNIAQSLSQTLSQLIFSALTVIGVLVMMLSISPLLTLVALVSIPIALLISSQVMKRSRTLFVQQWARTGALNAQIEEAYTGHELVSVFGRRREVSERFSEVNNELTQVSWKAQFVSGLMMPIMMFVGNLAYVVICVVGAVRVVGGDLTLGGVTAFVQYSRQFTQPLTQLASMVNLLQSGVASAERVFELLDAPEQLRDEEEALPTPTRGRVAFDDVTFGYGDEPLIKNLNLVAEPGQTVAIVGPTGAGKTTLVNLLMRFYELDGGRITLDGVDIRSVPRADLRSRVGMVLQDTWLFRGTIRDNIAYGNPEATAEHIQTAAEATFVDRFVHSLPDGYDTVIDDEGSNLSVGEKQLVTIARAFVADPALLVLDEATSSVDTRTEVLLQQAMAALRADRTSFVIAHRLSTIRDADIILVMEDGGIVEQGSHEELLAARGAYYRLHQAQFLGAVVDLDESADAPQG